MAISGNALADAIKAGLDTELGDETFPAERQKVSNAVGHAVAAAHNADAGGGGGGFEVAAFVPGRPGAAALLARLLLPAGLSFLVGLPGSKASARVLPASSGGFSVAFQRAGVTVTGGTITLLPDGLVVVSFLTAYTSQDGDLLVLTAPSPSDTQLADVSLSIAGTRT